MYKQKGLKRGLFYGASSGIPLGLLAVRKLSFVKFLLREIVTHYSFLTGTAFRFAYASLQPCQNPPNPQKVGSHPHNTQIKKQITKMPSAFLWGKQWVELRTLLCEVSTLLAT